MPYQDTPLRGPNSPQVWTYLSGSDLVSSTIYAHFRLVENKLELYPQPPPDGLDINFEYISRYWCRATGSSTLDQDEIILGSDVVAYEPVLIIKFLKAKFLEAKGFDATAARIEFENIFYGRSGKDTGAPILRAGGRMRYPYLNHGNIGDTGFGS